MTLYEELVNEAGYLYSKYYEYYSMGETPYELSKRSNNYNDDIKKAAEKILEADTIIVGGASGLSAAGGGDFYYAATDSFKKHFKKYYEKYGIQGAFNGMQYPFKTDGERWGYLITFLHTTLNAPLREPYRILQEILRKKEYFIVTTNQDTQFIKAFKEERVAQIQGDHRYFQCKNQCSDHIYYAVDTINRLYEEMGDSTSIDENKIPRCPQCRGELFPWVRGYGNFLEGTRYHQEYKKAGIYIDAHKNDRVVYLELGVGRMTPMFIQEPFWNLTASNKNAFYISINRDYAYMPRQIENQGIVIKKDILKALGDILKEIKHN